MIATPKVEQTVRRDAGDVRIGPVDLLIIAGTWDIRCLAVLEVGWARSPGRTVLLQYANKGVTGRSEQYSSLLREAFSSPRAEGSFEELAIDSSNLVGAWSSLKSVLIDAYHRTGRPISVAIDLTGVPRYVWLSILGFAANTGICRKLSFLYASAHDYEFLSDLDVFSEGEWKPRAIATLGNGSSPSAESILVVAAGFEGANTLRLVNALEPDRIAVALSSGVNSAHDKKAKRSSSGLVERYSLATDLIDLPMGNVGAGVANLRAGLASIAPNSDRDQAVSFLLCGSKVSALTVGLYALMNPVAQVYFSEPLHRVETTAKSIEWMSVVEVMF